MHKQRIINEKLKKIFCYATLSLSIGLLPILRGNEFFGIILFGIIFLLFILISSFKKDTFLIFILAISFLVRSILAILNVYIFPLPDSGADAVEFERVAWEYAQILLGNEEELSRTSNAFIFSKFIGVIYLVFDRIPIVAHLFNVITGVLIVYYIYQICMLTFSKKAAKTAATIAAFFPTFNLYSAVLTRECIIVLFFVISFYFMILWYKKKKNSALIGTFVFILLATLLHGGLIFVILVYTFIFLFFNNNKEEWNFTPYIKISALSLSLGIILFFGGDYIFNKIPSGITLGNAHEILTVSLSYAAKGDAAYLVGYTPNSLVDLVTQTPIRVFYFLFAPLPWMITSASHVVGFIDGLLYLVLSFYTIKGLKFLWKHDKVLFILCFGLFIVFLVTFAWGTSNFGTAVRHRQKIVWLLIIVAVIGKYKNTWFRLNTKNT